MPIHIVYSVRHKNVLRITSNTLSMDHNMGKRAAVWLEASYCQITFFLIKIIVNSSSRLFHFDFRDLWRCCTTNAHMGKHSLAHPFVRSAGLIPTFFVGMSNNNLLSHCIFVSNWNLTMKNSFICSTRSGRQAYSLTLAHMYRAYTTNESKTGDTWTANSLSLTKCVCAYVSHCYFRSQTDYIPHRKKTMNIVLIVLSCWNSLSPSLSTQYNKTTK